MEWKEEPSDDDVEELAYEGRGHPGGEGRDRSQQGEAYGREAELHHEDHGEDLEGLRTSAADDQPGTRSKRLSDGGSVQDHQGLSEAEEG